MEKIILYHGTLTENVDSILSSGINEGEGWGGANTSGVFLSGNKDSALNWAKMNLLRKNEERMELSTWERKYSDQNHLLTILQVIIPKNYFKLLQADIEQSEDFQFSGNDDDWELSLKEIGDVRFDGVIDPAWITVIDHT